MSFTSLILVFICLGLAQALNISLRNVRSLTTAQGIVRPSNPKLHSSLVTLAAATIDHNALFDASGKKEALNLSALRRAMPAEAFEKNLFTSLSYMLKDYACWGAATLAMWKLKNSAMWATLPLLAKAASVFSFVNVAGFFMWCIFVVGHDCGHTTFSKNKIINDIVGHFTHGSILVPFYPWQLSHRRHHMFHNHESKDYSHPWYTPNKLEQRKEFVARWMNNNAWSRITIPYAAWPIYLLGMPDGSHFVPLPFTRLYGGKTPFIESIKCLGSSAVVAGFASLAYYFASSGFTLPIAQALGNLGLFYGGPLIMFGWWLFTVTYLQHHADDTKVYDDRTWDFVTSAFETVDRTFGKTIDYLHHFITSDHVVHHLFYTDIPHYHLPKATAALKSYLAEKGYSSLYKFKETRDFIPYIHSTVVKRGYQATLAEPEAPISDTSVKDLVMA